MLAQRLRRWYNIKPPLGECLVLAGYSLDVGPLQTNHFNVINQKDTSGHGTLLVTHCYQR